MEKKSLWRSLTLLFGLVMLGAFVGNLVGRQLCFLCTTEIVAEVGKALHPRSSSLILQAFTTTGAFIAAPMLYLGVFARQDLPTLLRWRGEYLAPVLITLSLVWAFMGVNSWFIHWNATLELPKCLSGFEARAQKNEAFFRELTSLLTTFRSLTDLGVGILVMGVLPAIGEELLFRGIIQQLLHRSTRNVHGAISMSAFLFSAIHFQFYGFVPRFLLGMLFGYIYWWTKDLTFPVAAHFFNNLAALVAFFMHQRGLITQDNAVSATPSRATLSFFVALVVLLAHSLRRLSKKRGTLD